MTLKKRNGIVLLSLVVICSLSSARLCVKRFVGGKWTTMGDCGAPKNLTQTTKELHRSSIGALRSCSNDSLGSTPKNANGTSGVFDIDIPTVGEAKVYCDMVTDGGGWIVFQRRSDGSENFNRNWTEYVTGFGNATRELWLGLEYIHRLTVNGDQELRIDMVDSDGTHLNAIYKSFKIGPSTDKYRLYLAGYSGNATDALALSAPDSKQGSLNGQQFSTPDADHDRRASWNCAKDRKGGWWYNRCGFTDLNRGEGSMRWYNQSAGAWILLSFSEMKIRTMTSA